MPLTQAQGVAVPSVLLTQLQLRLYVPDRLRLQDGTSTACLAMSPDPHSDRAEPSRRGCGCQCGI